MHLRVHHVVFLAVLAMNGSIQAHDSDSQAGQLGKVSFATSCDPKVQPDFERGVAMLHSFWYTAGEKTFQEVLAEGSAVRHRRPGASPRS